MEITLKLKAPRCDEHPKYKVILKPRGTCEACWTLWVYKKTNRYLFNY